MHRPQEQVLRFHEAVGLTIGASPGVRDAELRVSLIAEEAQEVKEAIDSNDLVAAIGELCDLLYVVYGTAVTLGVDLEPFFDEIHRANMAKASGPVRADGKRLKPPGWQPPDLQKILQTQLDDRRQGE